MPATFRYHVCAATSESCRWVGKICRLQVDSILIVHTSCSGSNDILDASSCH